MIQNDIEYKNEMVPDGTGYKKKVLWAGSHSVGEKLPKCSGKKGQNAGFALF